MNVYSDYRKKHTDDGEVNLTQGAGVDLWLCDTLPPLKTRSQLFIGLPDVIGIAFAKRGAAFGMQVRFIPDEPDDRERVTG